MYPTPSDVIASMVVDIVNGYVVVYLGESDGSVARLVLNGPSFVPTTWNATDGTLRVGRSSAMGPSASQVNGEVKSMVVDTLGNGLVVANVSVVDRADLADCSAYATCGACLSAPSVYCGWCSLAARCTTRQECADPGSYDRSDGSFST